jgi:hypothetical protein
MTPCVHCGNDKPVRGPCTGECYRHWPLRELLPGYDTSTCREDHEHCAYQIERFKFNGAPSFSIYLCGNYSEHELEAKIRALYEANALANALGRTP